MESLRRDWRPWIFLSLFIGILAVYTFGGREILTLDYLQSKFHAIDHSYQQRPLVVIFLFIFVFVSVISLSIPGSLALTLLSGAIFGTGLGLLLVCLCSTAGALISFLLSRHLLRGMVNHRFSRQVSVVNRNLQSNSMVFLLSVRLIPVSPFVLINLVMGVTSLHWWTFLWTTLLGMIPGNLLYVYAGRRMSLMTSIADILTPGLMLSLTLLGICPWLAKRFFLKRRRRQLSL